MSTDAKIAWRNVWRNPRRSLLTISAIGFACLLLVFMLSFQFGSYETMIDSAVLVHTGHLQVLAEDYKDKREMRRVLENPDTIVELLQKQERIRAVTTRGNAFSLLSSNERTYGGMVIGIDGDREAQVTRIKEVVQEGAYLYDPRANHALVGSLLAKNLGVGVGDELVVLGQGRDGGFAGTVLEVVGLFATGQDDFDRSSVYVPLTFFQANFSMRGAVHEVVALADSPKQLDPLRRQLNQSLQDVDSGRYDPVAFTWKEMLPGLLQSIQMDLFGGLIFYVILVTVVAFSILNTFLMAVFERTHEFGVLLAIGTTPGRLAKIIYAESVLITALGLVGGWVGGFLLTFYFQNHGIPLGSKAASVVAEFGLPDRIYPKLTLLSLTIGPLLVLVMTLLTALYPVVKVRRLQPIEAMNAI